MRIVSLCPSNTELLAYIGGLPYLVGIDDYSDWPAQVADLPRVGPDLSIDMDAVARLQPDLVLASLSVPGMERNISGLIQRRIPHLVFNPQSFSDIARDLEILGAAIGHEKQAQRTLHTYHACLDMYRTMAAAISDKPGLYWEWWPKPLFTPGGTNWLTEMSELAGAHNIFAHYPEASVQPSWEEVCQLQPQHIGLVWVGAATDKMQPSLIRKRAGWEKWFAPRETHIHVLEESLYCRPSPRLLLGLQRLAARLHPEHFPPVDGDPLQDFLS